jgi:uroporphyrinogen-III synthase
VTCEDRIVYEKVPRDLTPPARAALMGRAPVVLPLFSPETARILSQQGPFSAPRVVVAMSGAVAEAARPLGADRVAVAETPDLAGMVRGIETLDA